MKLLMAAALSSLSCLLLLSLASLPLLLQTCTGFVITSERISARKTTTAATATSSLLKVARSEIHENEGEALHSSSNTSNNDDLLPSTYHELTNLPRHPTNQDANEILIQTEKAIRSMQQSQLYMASRKDDEDSKTKNTKQEESVYANSYVDLSKVSTIGFDYDYTLVTYTQELLELIYDMALKRLVVEKEYPREMLESGLKFDPFFSIRGEYCSFSVLRLVFRARICFGERMIGEGSCYKIYVPEVPVNGCMWGIISYFLFLFLYTHSFL